MNLTAKIHEFWVHIQKNHAAWDDGNEDKTKYHKVKAQEVLEELQLFGIDQPEEI